MHDGSSDVRQLDSTHSSLPVAMVIVVLGGLVQEVNEGGTSRELQEGGESVVRGGRLC